MKKVLFHLITFVCVLSAHAQPADWPTFMAQYDINWDNNVDSNFFHGAFIGDGIQGAMIMQDSENPNGLRMLMAHYKAIEHTSIPNYEYIVSKVYAGNIIIAPVGTQTYQSMRMNIYDGEVSGVITTDAGSISWRTFGDRKNHVLIVVLKGEAGEVSAKLGVREEWGISPRIYMDKKNPADYTKYLAPKPELTTQGDIDLVINKMNSKGAHVVASQLFTETENIQILYVAIGTSEESDLTNAATAATDDAVYRLRASIAEGYEAITTRHRDWWHAYMQNNYLEIKQDIFWQKFRYIQLYKLACASSEDSDLIMDTQGAWIWQGAWSGVWWNLNVQLSYPMFSSNKLDVGRAFINGMNRIYESGAFAKNSNNVGINIGRASTYNGLDGWGDELGNMPWLLQLYWRYWKYSGINSIGEALFPMLKDNATFLFSKLILKGDGKYHLVASRSPEYEETVGKALNEDANYGLMGLKWVLKTLLEMDTELNFNDPQRRIWQEKLDNLVELPTDDFGFRVNANQGFEYAHRHYSHLIGVFPLHIINPEQGEKERNLIEKSVDRWQILTQPGQYAGYTFTGGCAMYATLGDGDKAITTLDLMKSNNLIQYNTMYNESGGAVIETPLSVVESIDYMLIQSWNGIIRLLPAVPSRWNDIEMKDFRTEGAFLVSASYHSGVISNVTVFSEKGKTCTILSPWKDEHLVVKEDNGKIVQTTNEGEKFTFPTEEGKKYTLTSTTLTAIDNASIQADARLVRLKLTVPIKIQSPFTGISIKKNGADPAMIQLIQYNSTDSTLIVSLDNKISNTDIVTLDYSAGNIISLDSVKLPAISDLVIDNLLSGSAPRLLEAETNYEGSEISLRFNKKMHLSDTYLFDIVKTSTNQSLTINSQMLGPGDSTLYILTPSIPIVLEDTLLLNYDGNLIKSADNGTLDAFVKLEVQNFSKGAGPEIVEAITAKNGAGIQIKFNKNLIDIESQLSSFTVKVNGAEVEIHSLKNFYNIVSLILTDPFHSDDLVSVGFSGGIISSEDGGKTRLITDFPLENTSSEAIIVSQSSTELNGFAELALDGNTNGAFFSGSVTHTMENTMNPWWMMEFSKVDSISEIRLWNRTGCCGERLKNFYVFLSKKPFTSNDPAVVAADPEVWKYYHEGSAGVTTKISVKNCGQYLKIQINGTGTLALAEVEVDRHAGKCEGGVTEVNITENVKDQVRVYPNPVNSNIFIVSFPESVSPVDIRLDLYDIYGKKMEVESENTGREIRVTLKTSIAKGIYFLYLSYNGKYIGKKLMVNQ